MYNIVHRVGIKSASTADVYTALTTVEGLRGWWTTDTEGSSEVGEVLQFRFEGGGFDMRVLQIEPGARVVWRAIDGPSEWIDTDIIFYLTQDDDYTIVRFEHNAWREEDDFMCHCSTKWAVFLLSLKSFIETGSGSPWPHDLKIDNTNR
jgi:uncharacterized protein YndB with AHSA1/START domain